MCITSVPRMDRAPNSGWTGSRAVSLMPDAHGQPKQKREERLRLPNGGKCTSPWGAGSILLGSDESAQGVRCPWPCLPRPLPAVAVPTWPEWMCLTGLVRSSGRFLCLALGCSHRVSALRGQKRPPEPAVRHSPGPRAATCLGPSSS